MYEQMIYVNESYIGEINWDPIPIIDRLILKTGPLPLGNYTINTGTPITYSV